MTVEECYAALEGNYKEVMSRLMKPERVQKFAQKFLADGSFGLLNDSVEAGDWETAFRAAHTLKGVCQNLSFTKLFESSHELTEALRGGRALEDTALLERVKSDYMQTVEAIRALEG